MKTIERLGWFAVGSWSIYIATTMTTPVLFIAVGLGIYCFHRGVQ